MLIEFVLTRKRREVREAMGRQLVKAKVAREVVAEPEEKPKRQYRRRDMKAE